MRRTALAEQLKAAAERWKRSSPTAACWRRCRWRSALGCSRSPATSTTPTSSSGAGGARRAAPEEGGEAERDESVLAETGIRVLREKPVFTTPNVFPPAEFEQTDVDDDPEFREVVEPQHCYVCKQRYRDIHPFYDQLCPACGDFNYAQAHGDRRPPRPRRAAHRRTREDRLPGGDQAAAGGRAADRHDALPARRGGALRAGARLRGVGRPARGLRARPAPHAERRGVLHAPDSTRDRLDFIVNNACQTVRRPAEFYRHMLEARDGVGRVAARPKCAALLGAYEGLRRTDMLPAAPRQTLPLVGDALGRALAGAAAAGGPRAQRDLFPEGRLDQDLQQVDLRERNSWRLLLAEVSSVELLRRSSSTRSRRSS